MNGPTTSAQRLLQQLRARFLHPAARRGTPAADGLPLDIDLQALERAQLEEEAWMTRPAVLLRPPPH